MKISCKLIKELDDGSAIVSIELDQEAKDWLIGEGFTVIMKEAIKMSKTYVSPEMLKKHTPKKKVPAKKIVRKKK
jgi:hypothetical protein